LNSRAPGLCGKNTMALSKLHGVGLPEARVTAAASVASA